MANLTQKQLLEILKKKKHIIIWSDDDDKVEIKYTSKGFTIYEIPTVVDFMMKQFMADKNKEMVNAKDKEKAKIHNKMGYIG